MSSIVKRIKNLVHKGERSLESIWRFYIENINNYDKDLNALIHQVQFKDIEHVDAKDSDLNGIPIIYKDNICTKGIPTTCASNVLKDYVSPFDATVVERLKEAGMVCLGKSNLDEFAMGSCTDTGIYGDTKNPWDLSLDAGGSSGGSGAAVAARFAPIALGTDTGGSVRLPAYRCGVIGMKPSYGTLSRYGVVAYASSLDQVGVLGLNIEDIALVLDAAGGLDSKDSTSLDIPCDFFSRKIRGNAKAVIGIDYSIFKEDVGAVMHIISRLKHAGYETREIKLPDLDNIDSCYYTISSTEAFSNLSRYDGIRYGHADQAAKSVDDFYKANRNFGEEVSNRLLAGAFFTSPDNYDSYYVNAQKYRRHIYDSFKKIYDKVDCVIMPVCQLNPYCDGADIYSLDHFNVLANLIGAPSIAFPIYVSQGMPQGFQIMGRYLHDDQIIKIIYDLQKYDPILTRKAQYAGKDL